MASILARHAFGTLRRARVCHVTRTIHSTPVALKKKGKVEIEDLFADDAFAEDALIKTESTSGSKADETSPESSERKETTTEGRKYQKLDPAQRQARFDEHIKYTEPRVGKNPTIKDERIRKRHFLTLLDLAQSEADVRQVMELVPKFKQAGGELISTFAEAFARRCQELQCQSLALELFGDYAKYDVRLDLNAARWLVHSLYFTAPLEQTLIATSLYPVYNLPPISEDLATAAMVAAACYRHGKPQSIKAAKELQPHVAEMLEKVDLKTASDHVSRKQNKWISWALRQINNALHSKEQGVYVAWNRIPKNVKIQPAKVKQT